MERITFDPHDRILEVEGLGRDLRPLSVSGICNNEPANLPAFPDSSTLARLSVCNRRTVGYLKRAGKWMGVPPM